MPETDLQLYVDSQLLSPYGMSVFVTLTEKGIPFTMQTINLETQENRQQRYLERSLTGRVPTLIDGDFHLSESSAICEYLEERFPAPDYPSVYPQDMRQRAIARQIQAWLRSDFMPIREERPTSVIFLQPIHQPLSEAAQAAADRLFAAVDRLLPDDRANLFNDWCIADTDLALMLNRLLLNGDAVPDRLARYARLQWQRPAVQRWIDQNRSPQR